MIIDRDYDIVTLRSRCHGADATGLNSPTGVDAVVRAPQSHSILPGPTPIRGLPLPWYVAKWWGMVLCAAYMVSAATPLILLVALRSMRAIQPTSWTRAQLQIEMNYSG